MGLLSAQLFSWLQGARFYVELHEEAMAGLPEGRCETWLDIGCGPGLLTRIAAAKGYDAQGIDCDPVMISKARNLARYSHSTAAFRTADVASLPFRGADVVSASSLLAVLDDRPRGLEMLLGLVRQGGMLVLIEATGNMNVKNAWSLIRQSRVRHRRAALLLWALARQGKTVSADLLTAGREGMITFRPLLEGLAGLWIIRAPAAGGQDA